MIIKPKKIMRLMIKLSGLLTALCLTSCASQCTNPDDPYESLNRKVHDFNMAFDATMLRPPARLYKAITPNPIRNGINNAFNNLLLFSTVANDLLQFDLRMALRDTTRLGINSTIGIAGVFDPASQWGLPAHYNDMGLTLAKWGDKKSPYLVLPFLGPSTIRDSMGMIYDFTLFSPYPY